MFSHPPQITESQQVTNIHDTHASLVGDLPVGRPPDSLQLVVDPLEATMIEAEPDLIIPISAGNEDVCSYAKSSQVPVNAPVDSVADGVLAVKSCKATTALYGPWMHVSGRRSEGNRLATRAGVKPDCVNMVGKAKEVHPSRVDRRVLPEGTRVCPSINQLLTHLSLPIMVLVNVRANQVRTVGDLQEVQARVKKGSHAAVRISDPVEGLVVITDDPMIGNVGGTSIIQSNHRGLSVSKSSSKRGAWIRRLADATKSTLPILMEWVNSVTREFSTTADPPCVVPSID
ncbi:hypothetical protein V6N12_070358 [Hibiscus sabdariffa]|uniref:Uncharacterized protein n=1 Tax=Hibiscus sabdariffa TaxID=183260 RepID=A0ABR2FGV8_9ROSI